MFGGYEKSSLMNTNWIYDPFWEFYFPIQLSTVVYLIDCSC